jgi:hypothetical protein
MSKYYDEPNKNEYDPMDDTNDSEPVLTKYDLDMLKIEEDYNANIYMYNKMKDYIDNRNFVMPIMDKINISNFMKWFSEHLENDLVQK